MQDLTSLADQQPDEISPMMQAWLKELQRNDWYDIGYPRSTDLPFPALSTALTGLAVTNIGDPWDPGNIRHNTKLAERHVIEFVADLLGAPQTRWGYITSGSSAAVEHAITTAKHTFHDVVVYASSAAHGCITEITRRYKIPLITIRSDPHGHIAIGDLRHELSHRRDRSAMVIATLGTTWGEAIDDVAAIGRICEDLALQRLHLHADAALSGIPLAILPASSRPAATFAELPHLTSWSTSGHKFLATRQPCSNPQELHRMGEARCVSVVREVSEWSVIRSCFALLCSVSTPAEPVGCRNPAFGGIDHLGVVVRRSGLAGAAELELVAGVVQLHPRDAMFEAMLRGWRAQQTARGLREDTIAPRERLMRRFLAFTNEYPWNWQPSHVDEWTLSLVSEKHLAPSTVRGYQTDLRLFSEYVSDGRYGWAVECQKAFGAYPVPICHEWNTIAHLNEYEGSPEARPFTREELQRFLDYADAQVDRAVKARRKGVLTAYRDATLFKVIYGWGLRRTETSKLDLVDWGRNPNAAQFGRFGMLQVRYGKAVRGQPPRRRTVLSVMPWAVEAVTDYVENIRGRFGCADHPALWVTERGGRISPAEINARFVTYRDALGLPETLTPHSLRHSYVTHLTEDGVDRRFIQEQVGHRRDTSTAIYTHVSGEFMNVALRRALAPALDEELDGREAS